MLVRCDPVGAISCLSDPRWSVAVSGVHDRVADSESNRLPSVVCNMCQMLSVLLQTPSSGLCSGPESPRPCLSDSDPEQPIRIYKAQPIGGCQEAIEVMRNYLVL
jgi:hypothetical protein